MKVDGGTSAEGCRTVSDVGGDNDGEVKEPEADTPVHHRGPYRLV